MRGVVALPIGSSYPEIPDNCFLIEFPFGNDVFYMFTDRPHILLEQLGHLFLRQPDGFVEHPDFDAGAPVLGLIEEEVAGGQSDVLLFSHRWCLL